MDEMLAQAEAAVGDLLLRSAWATSTEECRTVVAATQTMINRLMTVQARHARELAGRGTAEADGAPSMAVWLRDRLRISVHGAKRLVRLGEILDSRCAIGEAADAGALSAEQVHVIADALEALPEEVAPDLVDECESALVHAAALLEPSALRIVGERVLALVAPEVADEALARKLDQDERSAYERRGLAVTPIGSGAVRLRALLDAEGAAVVRAAIDPLAAPQGEAKDPDSRTPSQRRADALVDICRAVLSEPARADPLLSDRAPSRGCSGERDLAVDLGADGTFEFGTAECGDAEREALASGPAGEIGPGAALQPDVHPSAPEPTRRTYRPQLCITVSFDPLRRAVGFGVLDTGETLSPEAARRLACDAAVLPAILDGDGQPLDLGRARRVYSGPIRRALVLRDRGCAFPHCDRPPGWTEGHHIRHWIDGGETTLRNGVLLCGHHHRTIHHTAWEVRMAGDGMPEFIPPEYVDPLRRPMRNHFHLRP